jgi:NO-binding membrane sensor protein with MHYT domain
MFPVFILAKQNLPKWLFVGKWSCSAGSWNEMFTSVLAFGVAQKRTYRFDAWIPIGIAVARRAQIASLWFAAGSKFAPAG